MSIFYIQVFGHRPSRKASYRRLMRAKEVADGAKPLARLSRLLRSQLTPFYLDDKSKKKEIRERVKRVKYNKKKRKEKNAISNCYTK